MTGPEQGKEPVFIRGGLMRLALYAALALAVALAYPYVYGFFDAMFWGR